MYRSVTNTLSIPHLEISQKSSNKRSPEAKYQDFKQFTGCIPECKFYFQNGRLEEDEGFD